ncbi:MAG: hypothetical protein CVU43_04640 [Chloroflexi bacterium HGW-Chloroflexi-5]|jgi:hypothetical protein|nr:MAG: hypothetical protein CVU43_04640 [Chloroflexi bacterium HGW-Chloroflexi-5]
MKGSTLPGTVQMRVITDKESAESLSKKLKNFLNSNGMNVIDLTTDFPDKYDPDRVKFFVVAVPCGSAIEGHRVVGSSEG